MFNIDWKNVSSIIADKIDDILIKSAKRKVFCDLYVMYLTKGFEEADAFKMASQHTKFFYSSKIDNLFP